MTINGIGGLNPYTSTVKNNFSASHGMQSDELLDILMRYANNSMGYSSLKYAVFMKDYKAIDVLINNGASIIEEKNILSLPLSDMDEEMFNYLVKKGAKLDTHFIDALPLEKDGFSKIRFLQERGHSFLVSQETLKRLIVQGGDPEVIKFFIESGVTVKGTPFTAPFRSGGYQVGFLTYAIQRGDVEIVRLLIDHGADLDNKGAACCPAFTPLYMAVYRNMPEIALLLIKSGARVSIGGFSDLECKKFSNLFLLEKSFDQKNYDLVFALCEKYRGYKSKDRNLLQEALQQGDCRMARILLNAQMYQIP